MAGMWILERIGSETETETVRVEPEVTMGRGLGVTHRILARSCPLMVSRNHCTFRITSDGHCLVIDNQSLNGVWVNEERIEPQQPHRLSEGDVIRLGVPLRDKERAEYEYRLTWRNREQEEAGSRGTARAKASARGRGKRKHSRDHVEPQDTDGAQCYTHKIQRLCQSDTSDPGTSRDGQRLTAGTDPGPSRDGQRLTAGTDPGPSRDGQRLTAGTDPGTSRDGQRLTAGTDPGPSRDGQRLTACTDPGTSRDGQRLTAGTDPGTSLMRKTCIQSCPSRTSRAIPGVQADALSVSGEYHSHVEELAASVHGLQELPESLPTEQQERKVNVHREHAAAQLTDVLENELQCIICSEHFIEAVTLNCSHSFCCHCIMEWRKRKEECPICRQTILTQSRSVVLDNCIERMLESLSEAMRERRGQLLKERKALKMKPVSVPDSESSSCDGLTSIQSVSTLDSSELVEQSDEGDTEDNPHSPHSTPVYYSI